jgi:hypothetical protein
MLQCFWWVGRGEERVPLARAFVGVRKRIQEEECTCCPGFLVGWYQRTRSERVPVARAFVGVRKGNQEGECTYLLHWFFGGVVSKDQE